MRVEKNPKAFAYRVPIRDYDYLQCMSTFIIPFNELMDKIVGFVITQLLSTLNNGSFLLTN